MKYKFNLQKSIGGAHYKDKIIIEITPLILNDIKSFYKNECINKNSMIDIEANIDKYRIFDLLCRKYEMERNKLNNEAI